MEELHDVQLTEIKPLLTGQNGRNLQDFDCQEHDVETAHGVLHVTMRGVAKGNRPTILTYHDIGLNPETVQMLPESVIFCGSQNAVYDSLLCFESKRRYQYPTMDELAEMLPSVLTQLQVKCVIGIGLNEPTLVEGLVLINVDPCAKGWVDWAAAKLSGWTSNVVDDIMGHHFSAVRTHFVYKNHRFEVAFMSLS
ncbi:Protein NDRG3 [Dissostichus eleginoides]|uniref:Protein NDRG3 n=1 Tax=Dissostichus eleginoides TaxID=100907 RepID=A0AAD9CA20_DISEL|nr:Protein NDRG3 [Dissostichus eleginoides]